VPLALLLTTPREFVDGLELSAAAASTEVCHTNICSPPGRTEAEAHAVRFAKLSGRGTVLRAGSPRESSTYSPNAPAPQAKQDAHARVGHPRRLARASGDRRRGAARPGGAGRAGPEERRLHPHR